MDAIPRRAQGVGRPQGGYVGIESRQVPVPVTGPSFFTPAQIRPPNRISVRRASIIAEPGGICISSSAYYHAWGKVGVQFADMYKPDIARPVRAYAVVRERLVRTGRSGTQEHGPTSEREAERA